MNIRKIILIIILSGIISTILGQTTAVGTEKKNFRMSGSIQAGSFFYGSNGPGIRQQPFGYSLGAQLNISLYGLSIPFYASLNEQGTAFQHPFNRYGLSPKYKWATAHIGWRSMAMSEFTLNNTTFLGGGLELKPGKFRFSFMMGNLKQPENLAALDVLSPQFKRKGLAFKIGKGTEENHFDFIVFKAKDDTNSVSLPDSVMRTLNAHENLVLGIKNKTTMLKKKMVLDIDAAASIFSSDIRFDPIQLSADGKYDWVKKIYNPNISTSATYAIQGKIGYQQKSWGLGVQYRRVMPDFKTLGSEYLLSDLEAITVNPSLNLMKGQLMISGSYGTQRNNLDMKRLGTNERQISSFGITYNPKPSYGFYAGYSNYTFQQQIVIDSLYNDSIVINQLTHNIIFTPRLTLIKENWVSNLILTINYQLLADQNEVTADMQNNDMILANLIYSAVAKKTGLTINSGINYFRFHQQAINISRFGFNVGASQKFFKKKLNLGLNTSYSLQDETFGNSNFFSVNLRLGYQIHKKTQLSVIGLLNNVNTTNTKYSEQRIQIQIVQGF